MDVYPKVSVIQNEVKDPALGLYQDTLRDSSLRSE